MSLGGLVAVFLCQLAALLAPLALGVAGLISGGTAGLTSIAAWFLVGIPLSYASLDIHAARRRRQAACECALASSSQPSVAGAWYGRRAAAGRLLRVSHLLRS